MSKSKKRKKLIGEKTHSNSPSGESSDEMSVGSQSTLFQDTEDIKSNDFYAPYRVNDYLRRYPEDITGNEYIVFVESTEETPIGTRDMMYLNNCFTRFIKSIKYLKKVNKYKVGIIFEKPSLANAFLDNVTFLKQQKLRALIPANTTEITGVITDVPIDMSNKKIFRALSSSKKIICVRRIMRKVKIEDKFEIQPTKTVAITFAASAVLPDAVCLKMWRLPVIPYIAPVKQCFNCLRYGHLAKFCKNAVCCSICTERHNFRSCVIPVQNAKCINCGGNHLAISGNCPIKKQKIMENKNKARPAAFGNLFDDNNFPKLNKTKKTNNDILSFILSDKKSLSLIVESIIKVITLNKSQNIAICSDSVINALNETFSSAKIASNSITQT
ncbi:unnamed protein product [Euphydryas editha]|uniref:CCHC-type domain-containing protein n=1 Tax=Euphydryas editha TaxID=104508 RepID=A0AAU9UTB7_EUPED|nr:unnamed protein product [Euphydryas editha]